MPVQERIKILEEKFFIQNNLEVSKPKLPKITQDKILHYKNAVVVLIVPERRFAKNFNPKDN